jgi:hypothetical protein
MIEEGRPLLPGVVGEVANPPWERARARVLIVRLSTWRNLDVSTSHLVLFDEVRKVLPEAYLDFAFLPPLRARKSLDAKGEPWFQGRVSGKSPADFDLVMVSNAFALELLNLPYLFSTAGLPLEARERERLDAAPIVVLGGSNASASGALVVESPIPGEPALDSVVDGIFFGEGEGAVGPLALILAGSSGPAETAGSGEGQAELRRLSPGRRKSNLAAAASVPGFWPCLHLGGAKRRISAERPCSLLAPLVLNGEKASAARLSISSGCPGFCSFCLEGWDRSPYTEASLDRLLSEAKAIRRSTGASDLELYSFNFNTYGRFAELIFELNRIYRRVSFMSQRLDILAETPGLMAIELAAGKRSFTLGVEGISSGMRAYYRKGLSEAQIDACAKLCLDAKAREMKLFYIVSGLETDEDMEEFERFAYRLGALKKELSPSTKVLISAGFLVRLPFTPLQFAPLVFDAGLLEGIGRRMNAACDLAGIEFRLASGPEEGFVDQALSLLGPAVRPWLLGLASRGIVYESSLPASAWASLKPFVLKSPEADAFLAEKGADFRPPLAFSEADSRPEVLYRHYLEARDRKDRKGCLGSSCSGCGACQDPEEVKAMTSHSTAVPRSEALSGRIRALLAAKDKFQALPAAVYLPEALAGAESEYRASWIMRRLSELAPGMENLVFEARERFFVQGGNFPALFSGVSTWYGWTVFELFGPSADSLASRIGGRIGESLSGTADPWIRPLEARPNPGLAFVGFDLASTSVASAKAAFTAFCSAKGQAFTARKLEGGWTFDMASGSVGRKLIAAARIAESSGRVSLVLEVGEKAELWPLSNALTKVSGKAFSPRVLGWEGFPGKRS